MEPFVFSIKDSYRAAVEAQTGGRNTVLYDDQGNPSVMYRLPKFNLDDVVDTWPNEPHPAFIVNGVVKDEIFISKYQNIIKNSRAYSIPNQDPATSINFDTARAASFAKGTGWHLMTNAEWAAIALWCRKNGYEPRGNNDYGQDISAPHEKGVETYGGGDPYKTYRVATGSGPASWSHDGTLAGIFDLNGNVHEWVDGLKLVDGKIWVHDENDFQTGNAAGDNTGWLDLGAYMDVDGTTLQLDSVIDNVMDEASSEYISHIFENMTADTGFTVPERLKYLAVFPEGTGYNGDYIYVRNYGERLPIRGGYWNNGSTAGVFQLSLNLGRSASSNYIGFRSAFVSL
jgi:hypothetical protein